MDRFNNDPPLFLRLTIIQGRPEKVALSQRGVSQGIPVSPKCFSFSPSLVADFPLVSRSQMAPRKVGKTSGVALMTRPPEGHHPRWKPLPGGAGTTFLGVIPLHQQAHWKCHWNSKQNHQRYLESLRVGRSIIADPKEASRGCGATAGRPQDRPTNITPNS